MPDHITIPIWIFLILIIITVLSVLDHIFIPSVRWFFRRRIYRVIDEISTKLDIGIRPFQLTKRQVLIDRLVYDPKVVEAIHAHSKESFSPYEVVQAEVVKYAKEIVPSFNAYLYFRIGYWLAKKIARLLYRVRFGMYDKDAYESVNRDSTVVFVMNHRSNMDYILVAFLAAERTTLSYAVGEWAKIWPLQMLIRAMGAFFVRRNSGLPLYRLVLERYVHMATREGVCQAVFLEGQLSRNGKLQNPKFGFIDYMLRSFNPENDRDIIFIPVGINYDRTIEDRSLLYGLDPQAKKRSKWFVFRTTSGFILHNVILMILRKWRHFGYACVNFGPNFSAKQYCSENNLNFSKMDRAFRFKEIEKFCNKLMNSIQSIVPVLPVPLVATVFLKNPKQPMSEFDIKAKVHRIIEEVEQNGAHVYLSKQSNEQSIIDAIETLKVRRMILESNGRLKADPNSMKILSYYANSIYHWRN
jgi:glycerol-3-phosphate O-acyltransferase